MDVTSAIEQIQGLWKTIDGVRAAPLEPPEQVDPLPIAITYERSGEMEPDKSFSDTWAVQRGVIWSEIHVQRASLPLGVRKALTFRDKFLRALRDDPNLGGDVMVIRLVKWTFLPMVWGGIDTIGYRFEIAFDLELASV